MNYELSFKHNTYYTFSESGIHLELFHSYYLNQGKGIYAKRVSEVFFSRLKKYGCQCYKWRYILVRTEK